ncbi:MAG: SpaA isopeptide-forming pilin-related protein, partial [Hydrogenoanaerobacterium sp.]
SKKITTGADGTARLTGLSVGSYTVTESKAPAGYLLNTVPQEFTIADNGLTTAQPAKALVFSDALAFGTVRLTKTNDDGSIKLAGAEFTAVKTDEPNKGATYIKLTDINGVAEYTLPIGTYTLTETKPPKGYAINTAYMQTVTVTANADPTKQPAPQTLADVKNTLILGGLEITKTDTTGKPLKGAKISLYKTDGNLLLGEKESHEDGKLLFDNLPQGEYYYIETVAPSGYILDNSKHAFIIETHRQMLTQTLKNKPAPHSNDGGGNGGVDNTPSPPPQIITPPPVEGGTSAPDTVPPNSSGNVPMTPAGKPEVSEEPKNGTVTVDGDGHWEYTPKPGFSGDDEFAVTVRYSDSYSETFVIKMSVLSSVVPFFPETGESSHVPFYVCGALLMAMGLGIRLRLRRRSKK